MKASTDPAGMTDDELAAAERYHRVRAAANRKLSFKADSKGQAAVAAKLADTHKKAADGCKAEAKNRKRAER